MVPSLSLYELPTKGSLGSYCIHPERVFGIFWGRAYGAQADGDEYSPEDWVWRSPKPVVHGTDRGGLYIGIYMRIGQGYLVSGRQTVLRCILVTRYNVCMKYPPFF